MHELQVTERILEVALQHASRHQVERIVAIHLRVGELSDLEDEWLQHYFDYLSKDSLAEDARLVIERVPIVLECDACSREFEIAKSALGEAACPECGESRSKLVSGRGYLVQNMEVI